MTKSTSARIALVPDMICPHRIGLPTGGAMAKLTGRAQIDMAQFTGMLAASLNVTVFTASGPRPHFSMMAL